MSQSSFNGLNYNWNVINSPYQSLNHQAYFFPQASPTQAYIPSVQSPYSNNYYNPMGYNNSYLSTPNSDHKSFSSGYGSENSSFSSPNLSKNALSYGNSYPLQSMPTQPMSTITQKTKSTKRTREESNKLEIMNQIFNTQVDPEPVAKKQKKTYKKKGEQNSMEPVNILKDATNSINLNIKENEFLEQDLLDENDIENFDFNFLDSDEISHNETKTSVGEKKKRVLTRNQRIAANLRERKRMNIMNESFVKLRESLPITTGRKRRKMSRLDIVVGAMEYISYLESLLEKEVPGEIDFDSYQNSLYLL